MDLGNPFRIVEHHFLIGGMIDFSHGDEVLMASWYLWLHIGQYVSLQPNKCEFLTIFVILLSYIQFSLSSLPIALPSS